MSNRLRVHWWRSIRTRIAAAVALMAVAVLVAVGVFVARSTAIHGRERLRHEAGERLNLAITAFDLDGRRISGVTTDPAALPFELTASLSPDTRLTYYDGTDMWAAQKLASGTTLAVQISGESVRQGVEDLQSSLLRIGAVGIVLSAPIAWLLAGTISRRLRISARAAAAIGAGEPDIRAFSGGRDEVAALTRAVDDMASALERRVAAEREFSADVAHELRTPVTGLVSAAELLDESPAASLVRNQVGRLRRLVEDLLEISRLEGGTEPVRLEVCDLGQLVSTQIQEIDPDVAVTLEDPELVMAEPRRVQRVLANLVANAQRHGGGCPRVSVLGTEVHVDDNGPGYPTDLLEVGPRRFHTETGTKGSGLGLTIALRQAQAMDGALRFSNRTATAADPGGASASLSLTAAPAAQVHDLTSPR
jgi:signal transduction histidine kinase